MKIELKDTCALCYCSKRNDIVLEKNDEDQLIEMGIAQLWLGLSFQPNSKHPKRFNGSNCLWWVFNSLTKKCIFNSINWFVRESNHFGKRWPIQNKNSRRKLLLFVYRKWRLFRNMSVNIERGRQNLYIASSKTGTVYSYLFIVVSKTVACLPMSQFIQIISQHSLFSQTIQFNYHYGKCFFFQHKIWISNGNRCKNNFLLNLR